MNSKIIFRIFILFYFVSLSASCPGQFSIFTNKTSRNLDREFKTPCEQNIFLLMAIEVLRPSEAKTNYLEKIIKGRKMKESSRKVYLRRINFFLTWMKKNNITEPKYKDILAYKYYLEHEKTLSVFSINNYLYTLKITFADLELLNLYSNVAKKLSLSKINIGIRKKILTREQATQLLDSIDRTTIGGKRDFALINLLLHTGLRLLEIVNAKIEDIIELEEQVVLLVQNEDEKEALVVLIDSVINPIKEYILSRNLSANKGPLFPSHSTQNFGKKMTTRSVSRIAKEALRSIGLDDAKLTAYSLRHTAIKFCLLGGATLQEASMFARHSSLNTIALYTDPSVDRIKNAGEYKVKSFLDGNQ